MKEYAARVDGMIARSDDASIFGMDPDYLRVLLLLLLRTVFGKSFGKEADELQRFLIANATFIINLIFLNILFLHLYILLLISML